VAVSTLASRLADIHARMARACGRAGRAPGSVRLIAVSKKQSEAAVREAYAAGQREFGENYAQELSQRVAALADLPDARFRFIGQFQSNKASMLARTGATVDTVDSVVLAEALSKRMRHVPIEVLIQVNVAREPQKAGVAPEGLADLVAAVRALPGVSLRGLMTVPPASDDVESARPVFRRLRELAAEHQLPELSMGMSADFEVAIEEGATMVRVGTDLFGPR
jgi:pyridoxal phosphate enzyme (YggS family)